MKKMLLALAVMAFVAAPAFANEAVKSGATSPSTSATSTTAHTGTDMDSSATPTPAPTATGAAMGNKAATSTTTTTTSTTTASNTAIPSGVKSMSGPNGQYFATSSGMTLYTFAKDEAGKSSCIGTCAKTWPALAATSTDKAVGPFTVINGSQWAFNGKPLYTYSLDKKPGDMNGASVSGWSIASSSPAPMEKPAH